MTDRWRHLVPATLAALAGFAGPASLAAQDCRVPDDTRARIESVLCGGNPDYNFSGARCFELSLAQRLRDTEAQVAKLEQCGHPDLAAQVREAALAASARMNALAVCLPGGPVDVDMLAASAADTVRNRGAAHDCSPAEKRLLELRLDDFRTLVRQAGAPDAAERLHAPLGVRVEPDGTVSAPD